MLSHICQHLSCLVTFSHQGTIKNTSVPFFIDELKSSPALRAGGGAIYIQELQRSSGMYSVACTALRAGGIHTSKSSKGALACIPLLALPFVQGGIHTSKS